MKEAVDLRRGKFLVSASEYEEAITILRQNTRKIGHPTNTSTGVMVGMCGLFLRTLGTPRETLRQQYEKTHPCQGKFERCRDDLCQECRDYQVGARTLPLHMAWRGMVPHRVIVQILAGWIYSFDDAERPFFPVELREALETRLASGTGQAALRPRGEGRFMLL